VSACRSCQAPIEWALTELGRRMPLDLGTFADGAVVVVGRVPADGTPLVVTLGVDTRDRLRDVGELELRRSHFQTCPNADDWRRA